MAESIQRNRIGSLRQRVTLQTISKVPDGSGGWVETWSSLATVWADVFPVSGNEQYDQGQLLSPLAFRCIIRHRADVTTKHRVLYRNQPYQIRSVMNLNERSQWTELQLERGVAT